MKKTRIKAAAALFVVCVLLSCIQSENDIQQAESALTPVVLALSETQAIPDNIKRIDLYVSSSDFNTMHERIRISDLEPDQRPKFDVLVSAGEKRQFTLTATDMQDAIAYEGMTLADIEGSDTVSLTVPLYGQGYISGLVFWVDPITASIVGPVTNHQEQEGEYPLSTDSDGYYDLKLPTRELPYRIEVNATLETDEQAHAFVEVYLTTGGDKVSADLFLVPKDDVSRPWICSVLPSAGSEGDSFSVFGQGFDPDLLPQVVFDPDGLIQTIPAAEQVIEGDTIVAKVPPEATSADIAVTRTDTDEPSNYVPFVVE